MIIIEYMNKSMWTWAPKLALLLSCLVFSFCDNSQQDYEVECLDRSITVSSDADLKRFSSATCISGDLIITGDKIKDVSFPKLTAIGGDLIVEDAPKLRTLDGLGNLVSIGDTLGIRNADSLEDLSGLEKLISLGGHFLVYENDKLRNFSGFSSLIDQIRGKTIVIDNPVLSSLKRS
jgi:hypothetical protein